MTTCSTAGKKKRGSLMTLKRARDVNAPSGVRTPPRAEYTAKEPCGSGRGDWGHGLYGPKGSDGSR